MIERKVFLCTIIFAAKRQKDTISEGMEKRFGNEIENYEKKKRLEIHEDPLDWWPLNKNKLDDFGAC
uniref:Uncharacterized protein n=1 Tax=Romanomermis culicivorax TaxID=13658 RepID=A0A915HRN0_ROMCU